MSGTSVAWRQDFMRRVATPLYVESLFDRLPDIVFSIKDREGRYVSISQSAMARCGFRHRSDAIGKTAFDLYPKPMAERYTAQDERLFRTGKPIIDNLDMTVFSDGGTGWCLSTKEPLRDGTGQIIGLACISKDLTEPTLAGLIDSAFAETIDFMIENTTQSLRAGELAARAGLSEAQFERRMKKIFYLSSNQYLIKARIDHATRLLVTTEMTIAEIAQSAGFSDQSAISRVFRETIGFTPRQYRQYLHSLSEHQPPT